MTFLALFIPNQVPSWLPKSKIQIRYNNFVFSCPYDSIAHHNSLKAKWKVCDKKSQNRVASFQRSAVMHMQRLLNNEELKNRKIMSAIKNIIPVNYDCCWSFHCENKTYNITKIQDSMIQMQAPNTLIQISRSLVSVWIIKHKIECNYAFMT